MNNFYKWELGRDISVYCENKYIQPIVKQNMAKHKGCTWFKIIVNDVCNTFSSYSVIIQDFNGLQTSLQHQMFLIWYYMIQPQKKSRFWHR